MVVGAGVVVDREEIKVDSMGSEVVGCEELELVVEVVAMGVVVKGSTDHMISCRVRFISWLVQLPMTL